MGENVWEEGNENSHGRSRCRRKGRREEGHALKLMLENIEDCGRLEIVQPSAS